MLEDAAFVLTRALTNHFKKTGDLDRRGKVDFTKTAIVKLSTQKLVTQATAIRDLGAAAVSEPDADKRGVTAARVAALTAAIEAYTPLMSLPRGQVVNRSTLLKKVETEVADVLEKVADMDDLVVQFDADDAGKAFIQAWKRARIIVDAGSGHAAPAAATPRAATSPTAPAKPAS